MAPREGTRLLRLRFLASGKTRKDFGADHGVDTPSYMSRLLLGERSPGRQLASHWIKSLKIPITAWDEDPREPLPSLHPDESGAHPAQPGPVRKSASGDG